MKIVRIGTSLTPTPLSQVPPLSVLVSAETGVGIKNAAKIMNKQNNLTFFIS